MNINTSDVSLITQPAIPALLKKTARSIETEISVDTPEGIPKVKVAVNIGVSEKSSFKNGSPGTIGMREKKAITNDTMTKITFWTTILLLLTRINSPRGGAVLNKIMVPRNKPIRKAVQKEIDKLEYSKVKDWQRGGYRWKQE